MFDLMLRVLLISDSLRVIRSCKSPGYFDVHSGNKWFDAPIKRHHLRIRTVGDLRRAGHLKSSFQEAAMPPSAKHREARGCFANPTIMRDRTSPSWNNLLLFFGQLGETRRWQMLTGQGAVVFCVMLIAYGTAYAADLPETLQKGLNKAKSDYDDANRSAEKKLLEAFEVEITLIRRQEGLRAEVKQEIIEVIETERATFEKNGFIPFSPECAPLH